MMEFKSRHGDVYIWEEIPKLHVKGSTVPLGRLIYIPDYVMDGLLSDPLCHNWSCVVFQICSVVTCGSLIQMLDGHAERSLRMQPE